MSDDVLEKAGELQNRLLALANEYWDDETKWQVMVTGLHMALGEAVSGYTAEPLGVFEMLHEADAYRIAELRKMKATEPERRAALEFAELEKMGYGYGEA